jgi:4-amino-4-deoxy-L-arabinose transferase-like glycosyltransferase
MNQFSEKNYSMGRLFQNYPWLPGVALAVIVVGGLFLRVLHIDIILEGHTLNDAPIRADAKQYIKYGYNLVHHNVYSLDYPSPGPKPDAFRSPGYPLLIATGMLLASGIKFIAVVLYTQAILGVLTVILTYLLARNYLPEAISLGAALLVGISPHLITMAGYLLTETLTTFLIVASLLTFNHALKHNNPKIFFLSGGFFGLGYLANETLLFLPFILAFWVILKNLKHPPVLSLKRSLPIVAFLTAFCVFPCAWFIRNAVSVPQESLTGYDRAVQTLSHGAYPGFVHETVKYKYFPYLEDPQQPQFGSSISEFSAVLWQRVRERPLRYISWYLFEKPYYFWSWNILQGQGDVFVYPVKTSLYHENQLALFMKWAMQKLHPILLLLLLCGVPMLLLRKSNISEKPKRQNSPISLYTTCLYFTAIFIFFAPWPRYSIILRPELYICALWSATAIMDLYRRKRASLLRSS